MTPQEMFVTRMRRQRERYRITLDEIAADTRINRDLLAAFEQNDLSGWPRGLYARAWVRAYAAAIGYDPVETVDEFCRLFPHGDRRLAATMRDLAAILADPSHYEDEYLHLVPEDRRASARAAATVQPSRSSLATRLARLGRALRGLVIEKPILHRTQYRERQ